jgi:hypothetical protein
MNQIATNHIAGGCNDPRRTDAPRALSQALRRVHVGPKKLKLDEETRWQIAGEAVEELRRYGGLELTT